MAASFSSRQGAFVVGLVGAPLAGAPFSGQSSAGGEAFQLTRGRMQPLVATLRNGRRPRATVCVRDGACTGWYASPAARLTRPYNRHLASAGRGMPRPYRRHSLLAAPVSGAVSIPVSLPRPEMGRGARRGHS